MNRFVRYSLLGAGLLAAAQASAVGTRRFSLSKSADFKGGDLKGVAVDAAGHVRAGFNLGSVPVSQGNAIWAALPLRDGSVLFGTGNEGKLLKLAGGAVSVLAETKALVITSLAEAWGGAVVMGTLPDGKVMKWEHGKLTDLVTLKGTEHVWQVAYDERKKALFAATGPEGKLYRISETGDAQLYFDAPEQHLMSVAIAADGTVYAGASDKAKLYKITAPGKASVLYDFDRTEVRAIAVNKQGEVFAIANEIKTGGQAPSRSNRGDGTPAAPASAAPKTKGKGTLYKFSAEGAPDQLLEDSEEHYTSLALSDDGRPYVGTGVEGRVYTVDASHNSALVADVDERQVSALVLAGKDQLVVASDPAVAHPVKGIGGPDAVWTSKVLDAGLRARFGKLDWEATGPIQLSTRTGNTKEPDDTWSAWSTGVTKPSLIDSPAARYLQVRGRFATDPSAVLSEIDISFVTDNLRAVITSVEAKDADTSDGDDTLRSSGGPVTRKPETTIALSWKVDNPDKDDLRYRLQFRQVGSNTWFELLKPQEKLTKESYSWDTADLPEGRYRLRLVATDELSNPPDRVTRDAMESSVVLVDNTPPVVEGLKWVGKRVQGVALDGVGPIARIEIALAGSDEWTPFYPTDGIFDEQREEFDADVSKLVPAVPALLSLRVYDKANNSVVRSLIMK
ncbi:MAG TPA: hypothetical protein VJV79_16085 [Polyangiaceae bacterium]|nr:hypothetical protein [Polyangiaceae bacterium]